MDMTKKIIELKLSGLTRRDIEVRVRDHHISEGLSSLDASLLANRQIKAAFRNPDHDDLHMILWDTIKSLQSALEYAETCSERAALLKEQRMNMQLLSDLLSNEDGNTTPATLDDIVKILKREG